MEPLQSPHLGRSEALDANHRQQVIAADLPNQARHVEVDALIGDAIAVEGEYYLLPLPSLTMSI
ncbi:MAG: hypothetical protein H6986_07455 [Pseudomonadales bacterium]|nr:hypothetical protein [Pseudomonadales bacterium]